jgi:hypothetical protein
MTYEPSLYERGFPLPYTNLGATVAKWRKLANRRKLTPEERHAYGEAVHKAVQAHLRKTAASRMGLVPKVVKPNCASGTFHNNGDDIHNAIRAQQRAALLACPDAIRRARSKWQWESMYERAMQEKRRAK